MQDSGGLCRMLVDCAGWWIINGSLYRVGNLNCKREFHRESLVNSYDIRSRSSKFLIRLCLMILDLSSCV